MPGAQAVVVTAPHPLPSHPRAGCHQVLSPGGGRGMEGWRTAASGRDWSDDAPRVCLLCPGCLHLLPSLALPANLSSHKEPLPVWIKLSINCSVKPPGRLSSAVIEGFPPPGPGQLQRRSVLPGAGVAGRPPCSPRGSPAFAPRLRAPEPPVISRRPGFLVTQPTVETRAARSLAEGAWRARDVCF